MADITMCTNKHCLKRDTCYRVQARPNIQWQSWSDFNREGYSECEFYIKMKEVEHDAA